MSPIIDIQRRMVEAGRIRAGDTSKGHPRKLDKWRLTSKDRTRLEAAAVLWGGAVKEWEGRDGEFELYTSTSELPIMLLPETTPSLYYELWSKGGCQRRCDGQTEMLSDGPCLCGEERECKPHLRFPVLLPDLKGIGSWLVQSTGWNAANEIPGAITLLSRATAQGVLMPARLRLEQRVEIKAGQTRRFAVPVIDVDVSFRELISGSQLPAGGDTPALPAGYTPIAPVESNGVSLAEGITTAETQVLTKKPRVELPEDDDILEDEPGAPPPPVQAVTSQAPLMLDENKHALDALVGQLREAGSITTRQLWSALARMRKVKVDEMIDLLSGFGTDGELHWAPLRDSLDEKEAAEMRKRLGRLWAEQQEALPV